ncbi:hypothetical protein A2U01_0028562 [Trifolium medium]|uniref:Uncharacterized protein n=1 Tax=Trifolium medium TaxID=97028 RepID=A0A392P5Z0_9FABA|nr:hypothetical protein [Trifolium medium]
MKLSNDSFQRESKKRMSCGARRRKIENGNGKTPWNMDHKDSFVGGEEDAAQILLRWRMEAEMRSSVSVKSEDGSYREFFY